MGKKIAVIGAGSWGTALAISLAESGHAVSLWTRRQEHAEAMKADGENKKYLPGIAFPETLTVADTMEAAIVGAELVMFSTPAQGFRSVLNQAKPHPTKDMVLVNVAKGIEQKSLKRLSEIAEEAIPGVKYVVLSGPSHAEEVGKLMPTTIVAAAEDLELAEFVQDIFMTEALRIYTNTDVVGVELGGALKNIIALGAGVSDGMGFGDNAKAALMTRGMTEMSRLGVALGAKEETFAGLTGMGDLIVTCTSMHSRNRRCGIMIGEGVSPEEAVSRVGMVVEGMFTAEAAYELAKKVGVEMPITEAIYGVINGTVNAREAVTALMTRSKKHEKEDTGIK
jgi:glycerol-3-phosphate dehydrogenase (NAD(P)+)